MNNCSHSSIMVFSICTLLMFCAASINAQARRPAWIRSSMAKMESELVSKYGEGQRGRLQRGLRQVAELWRPEDGEAAVLEEFVLENFAGDERMLDAMLSRFERLLEQLDGNMNGIRLQFCAHADLDLGPMYRFDEVFAAYNPSAHVIDDFFGNKLAFTVLLNFPLTTLEERLTEGERWTKRQWAEVRLAQRFSKRIPADVNLAIAKAGAEADQYIAGYNIWMHHLIDEEGRRLFPPKLRLLSHWNLRDEIKASYSDQDTGLAKQRMIQKVMERIVTQTIPAVVIDNPNVDWNPYTNEAKPAAVKDSEIPEPTGMKVTNEREADTRYKILLNTFLASKMADPYSPTAPSLIARRFDEDREIPEPRVKEMLVQVVSSSVVPRIAKIIESRIGRPLEPFDIWYNGFRPKSVYSEAQLDEIVSRRYPTAEAYEDDIPKFLVKLGFTRERAEQLADNIDVEPARGSGHAWGAGMRSQNVHLRTRVTEGGMNYKGFNIAVHEMGHNVEQTISLKYVDHTLLRGVPNTAFTEAFAFVFQARDLELLGLKVPSDKKSEAVKILNNFWEAYEIAGVSLVDMEIWHWMYDNPEATPEELKRAVIRISKEIWNRYYAPVFNKKDVLLLGIYSHIIHSFLYLPDYPIGHLIAFQVEEQMKKAGNIGSEFERMAVAGNIAPDLWMKNATGSRVGAESLIAAAEGALKEVKNND